MTDPDNKTHQDAGKLTYRQKSYVPFCQNQLNHIKSNTENTYFGQANSIRRH